VEYGENQENRDSSVRGGCQRGVGTEEMIEKPKSPYNLFGVGSGVRRETGKEIFLRTWWGSVLCWYGGNDRKAEISVQLVWCRRWGTERIRKRDISPYVVGAREVPVRRK
ncbi:MAG: hypothetical protein MJ126_07155, partial [Lachnospiraceae bacterium]|nr:hypothetical protein [Lachnospiraceae bacterium]